MGWQSGLTRRTRNAVSRKRDRRFESSTHRSAFSYRALARQRRVRPGRKMRFPGNGIGGSNVKGVGKTEVFPMRKQLVRPGRTALKPLGFNQVRFLHPPPDGIFQAKEQKKFFHSDFFQEAAQRRSLTFCRNNVKLAFRGFGSTSEVPLKSEERR